VDNIMRGEKRNLPRRLGATLEFAAKLTRSPARMTSADIAELRSHEFSDEAILHIVEVVAYFNFVNRLADGLGVTMEE
jgi:uncharacterized peroxidase-related enzyme